MSTYDQCVVPPPNEALNTPSANVCNQYVADSFSVFLLFRSAQHFRAEDALHLDELDTLAPPNDTISEQVEK